MSLYLQQVRGLSSLAAGVAFLAMMLSGAVLTPFLVGLAGPLVSPPVTAVLLNGVPGHRVGSVTPCRPRGGG